jgi:hypothetical protein
MKEMKVKINNSIKTLFATLAIVATVPFATANAAPITQFAAGGCSNEASIFPHWYDNGLCGQNGEIKSPNEMQGSDTAGKLGAWIGLIALNIVQILLFAVGYVSLGFIIYGGFKYMISGDSSSGTVAARKTIQNAIIGLVISILSVAIIKFVTDKIA